MVPEIIRNTWFGPREASHLFTVETGGAQNQVSNTNKFNRGARTKTSHVRDTQEEKETTEYQEERDNSGREG